jgi:hypothetical protein
MYTLEVFHKEFAETVHAVAAADQDFEHSAFVSVAVSHLADAGELSDFEYCHFRGTGSRRRSLAVDGYSFDDADGSARLLVADWSGKFSESALTQTEVTTLVGRVRAFVEDAVNGKLHTDLEPASSPFGLASELFARSSSIARYRIYVISDRQLSARIRDWPEEEIGGTPVEVHIWDLSRFHRVISSRTGRDDLEIDFTEYHRGGIPCLAASVEAQDYKAYLCVLPGDALARLYETYGSRLLEGNVRSFLALKGRVNKGIRTTILNEPSMFFAYNNGIAATASSVSVQSSSRGLSLVSANDLQIVNGGQTTASLALARQKDRSELDGIFVQMKLSVVPEEKAGEAIPLIAKYANTQNKVSEADFFSNHEFHRRMEQISRRVWAPAVGGAQHETHWFYERARGQFANETLKMTKSERARFLTQNPRSQLIVKTDLAKVENSARGLPHIVSLGAQKNFVAFATWVGAEWERSDAQFNDEYFRRFVVRTILFRTTEGLVSKQSWYQGGYRANIVAYAIAKLFQIIERSCRGRELDYSTIWSRQSATPALEAQLVSVAKSVAEVIANPPAPFQNVTEWAKKKFCWEKVESLDLRLTPRFIAELGDDATNRRLEAEARREQGESSRIEAYVTVVDLGGPYWKRLAEWVRNQRFASEEQYRLLTVAERIPLAMPNEKQSIKLLELRDRALIEGFREP